MSSKKFSKLILWQLVPAVLLLASFWYDPIFALSFAWLIPVAMLIYILYSGKVYAGTIFRYQEFKRSEQPFFYWLGVAIALVVSLSFLYLPYKFYVEEMIFRMCFYPDNSYLIKICDMLH